MYLKMKQKDYNRKILLSRISDAAYHFWFYQFQTLESRLQILYKLVESERDKSDWSSQIDTNIEIIILKYDNTCKYNE